MAVTSNSGGTDQILLWKYDGFYRYLPLTTAFSDFHFDYMGSADANSSGVVLGYQSSDSSLNVRLNMVGFDLSFNRRNIVSFDSAYAPVINRWGDYTSTLKSPNRSNQFLVTGSIEDLSDSGHDIIAYVTP
jgi:hypothetical protein